MLAPKSGASEFIAKKIEIFRSFSLTPHFGICVYLLCTQKQKGRKLWIGVRRNERS
jgi:hypothetical protein